MEKEPGNSIEGDNYEDSSKDRIVELRKRVEDYLTHIMLARLRVADIESYINTVNDLIAKNPEQTNQTLSDSLIKLEEAKGVIIESLGLLELSRKNDEAMLADLEALVAEEKRIRNDILDA